MIFTPSGAAARTLHRHIILSTTLPQNHFNEAQYLRACMLLPRLDAHARFKKDCVCICALLKSVRQYSSGSGTLQGEERNVTGREQQSATIQLAVGQTYRSTVISRYWRGVFLQFKARTAQLLPTQPFLPSDLYTHSK